MNGLINPLAVDRDTTQTAARTVCVHLPFRRKRDSKSKVHHFIAKLPQTEAAIDNALRNPNSGLLLDGEDTAAASRLMAEALSPAEMQAVARETIDHVRTHIGSNAAGVIVGAVPSCG